MKANTNTLTELLNNKNVLNKSQLEIDFRDSGLHKFQETAFTSAFAYLESLTQKQEPAFNPYKQD
jgi:hypothetical protein